MSLRKTRKSRKERFCHRHFVTATHVARSARTGEEWGLCEDCAKTALRYFSEI